MILLFHLTHGFASTLEQVTDDFPEEFFKAKVLPELIKSVEFGGGGSKALTVVLKIAAKLPSDDFESKITPFIVRAFANPDRGIRVCLLDGLPLIIEQLSQRIVNDKIFPQLVRCLLIVLKKLGANEDTRPLVLQTQPLWFVNRH